MEQHSPAIVDRNPTTAIRRPHIDDPTPAAGLDSSTPRHHASEEYRMIKLYTTKSSGNGYKVRLLASMLGVPFEQVFVDFDSKAYK